MILGDELGDVLDGLKHDAVAQAVLDDNLLLHYGQSLVNQQLDSELYRYKPYLKQKIRESGDFLLEMRRASKRLNAPMEAFMHPQYWDTMVEVAKSYDSDNKKLKIGHLIHKLCGVLQGLATRSEDDELWKKVDRVKLLYITEWSIQVSSR